jgi:septal ring factor EnvC (AmiA/AmiB activator)
VSRVSWLAAAALLACGTLAGATLAHADDEPHGEPVATAPAPAADPGKPLDTRAQLAAQLAAEAGSIDKALGMVTDKLSGADAARVHRLRAAYRIIQPLATADLTPADRMADARRRAAARLLLDRDTAERGLLADEAAQLRTAAAIVATAASQVPTVALPPTTLAWPAHGAIARHFGTIEHERSHTTLTRRGVDLEVEDHALAGAPADGTVRYAGPIRGLDNGVIVDHGTYFTVVGKLGELVVHVGATVHRGDPLGRAAKHRVYLEVRVKLGPGGLPLDPETLVKT